MVIFDFLQLESISQYQLSYSTQCSCCGCNTCTVFVGGCYLFPLSFSPQNFFQIISNLLEEENKEKWEDAQKVSTRQYT